MDEHLKANKLAIKIACKYNKSTIYQVDLSKEGKCYRLDKHTTKGVKVIRDNLSLSKAIELLYIILDCIETE